MLLASFWLACGRPLPHGPALRARHKPLFCPAILVSLAATLWHKAATIIQSKEVLMIPLEATERTDEAVPKKQQ